MSKRRRADSARLPCGPTTRLAGFLPSESRRQLHRSAYVGTRRIAEPPEYPFRSVPALQILNLERLAICSNVTAGKCVEAHPAVRIGRGPHQGKHVVGDRKSK